MPGQNDLRHFAVQVPATSANLGPGFDAFGLALDRYLTVKSVDRDAQPMRVRTDGPGASDLPGGDDNLVWRSFVTFCERYDVAVPDVALRANTAVPLERGLGSSSSAIVAGLVLARAVTGAAVSDQQLVETASLLEGHPDNVAPALLGGLVACTYDDDGQLVIRRLNPASHLRPFALVPTSRQATHVARSVVPTSLPREDVAVQAGRAGHVLGALAGLWPADHGAVGDRLHEPARLKVMEPSAVLIHALRDAGVHAWLSGAGPSIAAVVPAGAVEAEQIVAEVAGAHQVDLYSLSFDLSGALTSPADSCAFSGSTGCMQCPHCRV